MLQHPGRLDGLLQETLSTNQCTIARSALPALPSSRPSQSFWEGVFHACRKLVSKTPSRERRVGCFSIREGITRLLQVTLSTNQRTIALSPPRPSSGGPSQSFWEGVVHASRRLVFQRHPPARGRVGCVSIRRGYTVSCNNTSQTINAPSHFSPPPANFVADPPKVFGWCRSC